MVDVDILMICMKNSFFAFLEPTVNTHFETARWVKYA